MTAAEIMLNEYTRLAIKEAGEIQRAAQMSERKEEYLKGMLKSSFPTGIKVQQGGSDRVTSAVVSLCEIYNDSISRAMENARDARLRIIEIENKVEESGLSDIETEFVKKRYFLGMPMSEVAVKLRYSPRGLYNVRKGVLKKINSVM